MKKICVFCGSSSGNTPVYSQHAKNMALTLYNNNKSLVYGGGSVGLMGILADELLDLGGEVTGVIPEFLVDKEVDHKNLTQLIIVKSMHERKQTMSELSDGFIAMPGGFGTLEELSEILTWAQLGLVKKPIGILNANGYYNDLINLFDHMVRSSFLKIENREIIHIGDNPALLLESMENYVPKTVQKWIDKSQT